MKELLELINKHESIVIYTHRNPDGDCNGSAIGLKNLILDNVPSVKKVYVAGVNCPDYLSFLGNYDDISDDITKSSLSIVVDTGNAPRIGDQRYINGLKIAKIDHHIDSELYGVVNIIEHLSSCCELVLKVANTLGWKINKQSALPLLTGMITDTGRFKFLRSADLGTNTFKAAAQLSATGIDVREEIYNQIYKRDPANFKFNAWYLKHIKFSNKFAYCVVPKRVIKHFKVNKESCPAWLFNMEDLIGIDVWAQFVDCGKFWRCEYRSKNIVVNEIARKFGGGGHKQAAGSQAKNYKEIKKIIEYIKSIAK